MGHSSGDLITVFFSKSYPLVWSIMARLTYNTYLLHMPIIYLFNYSQYLQKAEGATELMVVLPFVAVLSFSAASVFYFFVEAPLGHVTLFWIERIDQMFVNVAVKLENLFVPKSLM